jgi:hypothetical protein
MKTKLIRGIGITIGAIAIYALSQSWDWFWWTITGKMELFPAHRPWLESAATITLFFLAISKLVAAYGLYRVFSWARLLALVVLSFDVLLRLAGLINVMTFPYRHPEMWERLSKMVENFPKDQIQTYSMWPSHIIGILSIVFVIVLTRKPIKDAFA